MAGWAGGRFIDAGYTDHVSRTSLSVEYAGFGSQQLLPVIAQLFSAPRGSLIMVEEPEISLHPEAQVELIKMFGDAIHHGQQLLITTHSETLLLALPRLAAFDKLTPADVAVYHLSRDEAGAHAAPLQLEDTWYIRDWVPSFAEVESQLIKEWGTNLRGKLEAGK